MTIRKLFPTEIYTAPLKQPALTRRLRDECEALAAGDEAGRRWSATHYPGGYTSYGSLDKLHAFSAPFIALERAIRPHALRYAQTLGYELRGRRLAMTDCWANVMPAGVMHGSHLHPLSFISGTYYVDCPRGSAPIKFEDPRLGLMMAAPPRAGSCPPVKRPFVSVPAKAGQVVLFESWLRHEVPPSRGGGLRISVSFNYAWEAVRRRGG